MTATPSNTRARSVELAETAARLLLDNRDLAERIALVTLTSVGSRVKISLCPVLASLTDLAVWAERYGAVVLGNTRRRAGSGEAYRECVVKFDLMRHRVEASVHIPFSDECGALVVDRP